MRKRRKGEWSAHAARRGNSFSAGRPRKCGENVVAAASIAEIYYSVMLQAHSRGDEEREEERRGKRGLHGDALVLLFVRAFRYTRDSVFQARLRSPFVRGLKRPCWM